MKKYKVYSEELENKINSNKHLKNSNTIGALYEDETESLNVSGDVGTETSTSSPSIVTEVAEIMASDVGMYFMYGLLAKRVGGIFAKSALSKIAATELAGTAFGSTAGAAGTATATAATGGFWSGISGGISTAATAIYTFFGTAAGIAVAAVGLAVWGFFYLRGDPDMYEIKEIWKSGKHTRTTTDSKIKKIYKLVAGGLYASKNAGMYFLAKLNNENAKEGKFTVRISDNKGSLKYVEKYMTEIESLGEAITNSPLMTELFAGNSKDDWVDQIFDQYVGYNVSGKKDSEDYSSLKNYVTKYMLENGTDENNPYKVSVAEEAEGWYDTAFGANIPGMNILGWASWMLSEEYLNQANSVYNITNRKWIHEAMRPYWIFRIDNLDASEFGINHFAKYAKSILGNGTLLSNVGFLRQLEYGMLGRDGKYTTKGNFEDLVKKVGPFVTKYLKYNAASDKKVPVTNVTLAFACFWATYALIASIWEGSVTYLALMGLIHQVENGSANQQVLKAFGIDDEYALGIKVNQRKSTDSKKSKDKKSGFSSVPNETHIKNADEVIKTFKEMPGIEKFKG